MLFNTNKEKGNAGLAFAITYFTTNGYTISIPLNDTQDYDLVIEKNNIFKTVQAKASSCKNKNGNYQIPLKSCGGTNGSTYKTLIDTNVDYLFILTEKQEIYLIPTEKIKNRSTLTLYEKYKKYRKFI